MDQLRLRWLALATYRYLPYVLTFAIVLLAASGVEAQEMHAADGSGSVFRCFMCGCSPLSHPLPIPYGCSLILNGPFQCWIHPGYWCSFIFVEI